jgi:hypothetical protein
MADREDIVEARQLFVERLNVDEAVARRLLKLLLSEYRTEVDVADRATLLYASTWAADRLLARFDPDELATAQLERLRHALTEGCPLCAFSTTDATSTSTPRAPLAMG